MDKKQSLLTVVLAVVAGFVGGLGSSWFLMGSPVFAQKTPEPAKVIQAERFEVVDARGNIRAGFGLGIPGDTHANASPSPGLYLLHEGTNSPSFSLGTRGWDFLDDQGRELVELTAFSDRSDLSIGNSEGLKLHVGLDSGQPSVDLRTATTTIALRTGERGEGELDMTADGNEARLGIMPKSDPAGSATLDLTSKNPSGQREHEVRLAAWGVGPSLSISSGADFDLKKKDDYKKLFERAEIDLGIDADGPSVALKDNNGKLRAVLGQTNLGSPSTGSVEK